MEYKITKYPDSTSYVTIDGIKYTDELVFRINGYEDLWHLNQLVDAANNMDVKPVGTIMIPNLIDAQADRRFGENQSNGLKLVCGFLNRMDVNFKIFHPHNPEVVEALLDKVEIIDNSDFILQVLNHLGIYGERESMGLTLMSSDAGGFKPLMKLCDKIGWNGDTCSASKSRKWDYSEERSKLVQLVDRDDFDGKDVLIVDDICVYGGTFKGFSKILRERSVGKLYLAVSHMTVQNLGEDPVTDYFDEVFTTNSKFDSYYHSKKGKGLGEVHFPEPKNLKIIKLF